MTIMTLLIHYDILILKYLSAISIPCLFMNVYVFPRMEKHLGVLKTYNIGAFILFITTLCIPFLNELCDNR